MATNDPEAPNPLGEALRMFQEVGARMNEAARGIASEVAKGPAGPFVEPMAQLAQQLAAVSTAWVGPVKGILDQQQDLVDAVAAWSEQQRILADRFSELAERHRQLTEQTMGVLGPLLDQVERLGGRKEG
jgi:ABC-type transporter Mla subunit MlaD